MSVQELYLSISRVALRSNQILLRPYSFPTLFPSSGQWAKAAKSFAQPFIGSFVFLIIGLVYTLFFMAESKMCKDGQADGASTSTSTSTSTNQKHKGGKYVEPEDNAATENSVNSDQNNPNVTAPPSPSSSSTSSCSSSSSSSPSSPSCCSPFLAPFIRTARAFRHEGERKWNWRLILPVCVFFFSFCANVGGRQAQSLFEENLPFCWDADWMVGLTLYVLIGWSLPRREFVLKIEALKSMKLAPCPYESRIE